jgi:hypothetical protein
MLIFRGVYLHVLTDFVILPPSTRHCARIASRSVLPPFHFNARSVKFLLALASSHFWLQGLLNIHDKDIYSLLDMHVFQKLGPPFHEERG